MEARSLVELDRAATNLLDEHFFGLYGVWWWDYVLMELGIDGNVGAMSASMMDEWKRHFINFEEG